MAQYRKAVVAVVGAGVIVLGTLGVAVGADVPAAVVGAFDSVVALLTALGVREVANEE